MKAEDYCAEKAKGKIIVCDECGYETPSNVVELYTQGLKNEYGKNMEVTCMICQSCNNVEIIYIEDDKTKEYQDNLEKIRKHAIRLATQQKELEVRDLVEKQLHVQKQFDCYEKWLKDRYKKYIHLNYQDKKI